MITQNLSLNLIPSGVPQRINVSQYDNGETIAVTLYNGATPFTLPSGASVYVSGTKADNTGFEYACSTSSGVSFTITDQMTVFAGEVTCELSIYQGNNRLSTINFILNVEKAALSEDTEISQTDIPIIENIPQYVTQAANSADLAHKWATFGAASEQPSASNNAKYWAERAAQTDIGQATTVAYTPDTAPYSFRRSTHNAVYDKLVGISWVENQLVPKTTAGGTTSNGITFTNNGDGSWTITGTPTTASTFWNLNAQTNVKKFISGHKYYVNAKNSQNSVHFGLMIIDDGSGGSSVTVGGEEKVVVFTERAGATQSWCRFQLANMTPNTDIGTVKMTPQIIDLTLMFGTAIADKIYTMEQATAGSGLAWIRQYGFLNDGYIAYNVGQIKSAIPKWRKVVGFNVWDGIYESGKGVRASDGAIVASGDKKATGYIPVLSNTTYYIKNVVTNTPTYGYAFYDGDKQFISGQNYSVSSASNLGEVTTPSNARFVRFTIISGNQDVDTVCINISDTTKNGTYEPYTSITYPLGSDELRGVPTLSGNNLVADGDVKTSDGVVNSRYGIVDLGSLNWTANSSHEHGFSCESLNIASGVVSMICSGMSIYGDRFNWTVFDSMPDKCLAKTTNTILYAKDLSCTTAAQFKTAMSGVYLVYPLATPTTSVSTPFTSPQVSLVTEETDTPCGHDSVVVDIPEWMRNQYFDDVRAEASKAELLEQFLDIKVEDKTSGGYARFKRCGNHVECTINSYSVTDGGAGIEVPEQFRTSVAEYGFAFASTESAAVAVTYAPSTNKLTFRNSNLTSYATGNMHGSISWYIE